MAKSKSKNKASQKALSNGALFTHEATSQIAYNLGRQPDVDEVLRKAGVARNRLEILLNDDEIAQAMETRCDALLGMPYRFEPVSNESELLKQEFEEWFVEIAGGAWKSLQFGYSVLEAVYQEKDTHIGLGWIGEKPLEWFEPKNDGRLIYRQDGSGIEQEVDQQIKFFLTRNKATFKQPYGVALLSKLYWLWHFKHNGFKFWAKFLERFGTPILLGKCRNSDTSEMNQALLNAHAQSVLSIDAEDDVSILTGGASGSAGTSFDTFNNALLRQIQKLVLGQTLTSGTDGTGSRALGEVHDEVRQDKLKSDIRLINPTLQAVVNALCDLNGWQRHKIIIGEENKIINKDLADRDAVVSGFVDVFSDEYLEDAYGYPKGAFKDKAQADKPSTTFSALPKRAFSFKADAQNISQEQQEIDEITDSIDTIKLLDQAQIVELARRCDTQEQLFNSLLEMIPTATDQQFTAVFQQALFTADVLGYVDATQGK